MLAGKRDCAVIRYREEVHQHYAHAQPPCLARPRAKERIGQIADAFQPVKRPVARHACLFKRFAPRGLLKRFVPLTAAANALKAFRHIRALKNRVFVHAAALAVEIDVHLSWLSGHGIPPFACVAW